MRLPFLGISAALALLLLAPSARAQGFQIGPEFAVSVPTGDAGDVADLGFNPGLTATFMVTPSFGIGGDLAYHHWPGSDDLNAATDQLLSALVGFPVTGSEWTWSSVQATLHMKFVAPTQGPVTPWLKGGFGVYNLKAKLEVLGESEDDSKSKFGFNGGGGIDFTTGSNMTFGIFGAYHYIPSEDDFGANFTAFTAGAHLLFGMR